MNESQTSTFTEAILIPPGGHIEFSCANLSGIAVTDNMLIGDDDVRNDKLNSLEAFMVRPAAAEHYESLSTEERKQLEGLEGFALASAIEDLYLHASLDQLFTTLPSPVQKKILKLNASERYKELLRIKSASEQSAYDSERQLARKTTDYIKSNMVPQQQSLFAPYPHDLARRSIFFIEENESMKRELLDDFVVGSGPWGLTTYSGKKLYTADEKAWVVLLGLAGDQKKRNVVDWHVVKGSIRSFLREAGLSETGQYSERFIESIQAMHGGVFRFEGKTKSKEDGKPRKQSLKERIEGWHLISSYSIDNNTSEFIVILDRAFIETFIAGFHMYARLDIKKFCKQRPTASALHRFFAGHTPPADGCIRMNMFLVAKSTNMLTDYPQDLDSWPTAIVKVQKKRVIARALLRLVEDGTFGPRTGIINRRKGEDDMVVIDYDLPDKKNAAVKRLRK